MNKKQMKNTIRFSILLSIAAIMLVFSGCDSGPAKISGLTTTKDKDGKTAATAFKAKDTVYAKIDIGNNHDDTKIKSNMTVAEDFDDVKKGGIVPGTDETRDFSSDNESQTVEFSSPDGFTAGKYTVNVELLDKDGKKLDSKSADITIESSGETAPKSSYGPNDIDPGGD